MPRVLLCSGPGLSAGCRGNEKNIRSAVPEASIRGVHTPRESRPAGHDGHDGAVLGAVLPSPVVRPRTPGDLPTLVRSLGEQQPTSSYPMRWPLPFPVEQFIVREGQERSWVVVLGGRVVGHVGVGRPRGDVERAFLDALGVDDTAGLGIVEVLFTDLSVRGSGIGGLLLDTAVSWLRGQGRTPVLDVVTDHGTAIDVYRHRGWRQVGSIRPPWLPESEADLLLMVLPGPPVPP